MKEFNQFGQLTPEFGKYVEDMWQEFRDLTQKYTTQAIEDGYNPKAIASVLTTAVDMGTTIAAMKASCEAAKERASFG